MINRLADNEKLLVAALVLSLTQKRDNDQETFQSRLIETEGYFRKHKWPRCSSRRTRSLIPACTVINAKPKKETAEVTGINDFKIVYVLLEQGWILSGASLLSLIT